MSVPKNLFELRYTIPGYTFILFIAAININLLLIFVSEVVAGSTTAAFGGIIIGVLAFLGGIPFGFLVSQLWYLIYYFFMQPRILKQVIEKNEKTPGKKESKLFGDRLRRIGGEYKQLKNRQIKPEYLKLSFDYIFDIAYDEETKDEKPRIKNYITRRWNLFNILGATFTSLILSLIVGTLMYFYFQYVVDFSVIKNSAIEFYFNRMTFLGIPIHILLIGILSAVLLLCIFFGMLNLAAEHAQIGELVIQKVKDSSLRKMFPKEYFNEEKEVVQPTPNPK